jgi:hypothetical protein
MPAPGLRKARHHAERNVGQNGRSSLSQQRHNGRNRKRESQQRGTLEVGGRTSGQRTRTRHWSARLRKSVGTVGERLRSLSSPTYRRAAMTGPKQECELSGIAKRMAAAKTTWVVCVSLPERPDWDGAIETFRSDGSIARRKAPPSKPCSLESASRAGGRMPQSAEAASSRRATHEWLLAKSNGHLKRDSGLSGD